MKKKDGENNPREELSEQRTELSETRTDLSEVRTELADKRTDLAEERTDMANERTLLARERTEMAKERNHLANERTFQAWIRTSLSLMGLGFVIEQFAIFIKQNSNHIDAEIQAQSAYSWVIGVVLIITGIIMLIIAYFRYLFIARKIGHSKHFPSKWLSTLVVLCIAIGVALILYDLTMKL